MSIVLASILAFAATAADENSTSANKPLAASQSPTPSANQPNAQPADAPVAPITSPRSGKTLADAVHASLIHWAKAKGQDVLAAGRELLGLYQELLEDKQLAVSQREKLRMSVRGRLFQLLPEMQRIAKQNQNAAAGPKSVAKADANTQILAQQGVAGGGGGAGMGMGGGGNAQNNNADAGQELVDLIQNTISPKSWDINGGSATIYYWRLQHAIVVHGGDDVQEGISDTLDQLNRAGH
jgi:hypothetical protein